MERIWQNRKYTVEWKIFIFLDSYFVCDCWWGYWIYCMCSLGIATDFKVSTLVLVYNKKCKLEWLWQNKKYTVERKIFLFLDSYLWLLIGILNVLCKSSR